MERIEMERGMIAAAAGLMLVGVFGVSLEAAIPISVMAAFCSMFQHANLRTPRWLGYLITRPESHAMHHARGVHQGNYGDVPWFDMLFGTFHAAQFGALITRIWGQAVENQVLLAVPMFIFMGTMLERSGVAEELLKALQVLTRRVPGGLAMSVVIMGTIMAATTGIVGATVVTMGLLSLPTMLRRNYSKELACGTIAASGTLGQLIPPSIVLVLLAAAQQRARVEVFAVVEDLHLCATRRDAVVG